MKKITENVPSTKEISKIVGCHLYCFKNFKEMSTNQGEVAEKKIMDHRDER